MFQFMWVRPQYTMRPMVSVSIVRTSRGGRHGDLAVKQPGVSHVWASLRWQSFGFTAGSGASPGCLAICLTAVLPMLSLT